jgi:hypothetical protein
MKAAFSAVIVLGLGVAIFQGTPAQAQTEAAKAIFKAVPTPNENFNSGLFAASASSPNDIWAVGESTIHFDGTKWTAFPAPLVKQSGNTTFLQGVVAISPTLAWTVGNITQEGNKPPLIEQWDGAQWSIFPGPKFGPSDIESLFAITSTSAGDIWAVGDLSNMTNGTNFFLFEHFDGTAWTATTLQEKEFPALMGVSADAPNDVWAVGTLGIPRTTTLTAATHFDGSNWTQVKTPNVRKGPNKLNAVLALAPNDVWAVGFSTPLPVVKEAATLTLIEHFDGKSWKVVPSPNVGPKNAFQRTVCLG